MSRGVLAQQLKSTLCTILARPVISTSTWSLCGSPVGGSALSTVGKSLGEAHEKSTKTAHQALAGGSAVLSGELLMQLPATGKSISSKGLTRLQAAYQHNWKRGSGSTAACLRPEQPFPPPGWARAGATSSTSSVRHRQRSSGKQERINNSDKTAIAV